MKNTGRQGCVGFTQYKSIDKMAHRTGSPRRNQGNVQQIVEFLQRIVGETIFRSIMINAGK